MANGPLSSEELLDILDPGRIRERPQFLPDVMRGTTGNSLIDFLGQALWSFSNESLVGSLGVSDAISESIKGDAANTWEEMLAGGAAGDWEELSSSGKAGAMVGGALGQIPSFFLGGLITKTAIKGAGAVGGRAVNMAVKKSVPELIQAGKKLPIKKGVDVAKTLTDDAARTIVDDAFDLASSAGDIAKLEGKISQEIYEESMNQAVKANIRQTLEIVDEELLEGLSRETVRIITKNNPQNAEAIMKMLASKVPLFRGSEKASMLLGALGYDAAIGFTMGTMRVSIAEIQAATWNVRRNEFGEYEDIGLYDFDLGRFASHWIHDALTEALVFAPFGVVKHINPKIFGGKSTGASHGKRLANMVQASTKAYWKRLGKYTNKELRMQLTAMDEIAGGTLNSKMGHEFAKLAGRGGKRQWWVDATTDADTVLMRKFLGKIRRKFVSPITGAWKYWAGEFGVDVLRSVPRMAAGVVAMNSTGLINSFRHHGFSMDALSYAMGDSPQEIAANIFTAMYFTRKPHSFHVEATPGIFSKLFETGRIENYTKAKASKLRKMVGGLNTFGADQKGLQRIIMNYGHYDVTEGKQGHAEIVIKKTLDSTPEFNELENIFKPYEGRQRTGTTDLKTAFSAHIAEMVRSGEITYEESLPLYERLFVAEKIIDLYNRNTSTQVNVDSYTPAEAFDIVNKVSTIKFGGNFITKNDPTTQIEGWMEGIVEKAVLQPQNIMKEYLVRTYEALGIDIELSDKAPMKAPNIWKDIDLGDGEVNETLSFLYNIGVRNNWIEEGRSVSRDLLKFTGEDQVKVREIFDNSVNQMMSLVHGENWGKVHEVDNSILVNRVWAMTNNDLLIQRQRYTAYELFTGGTGHNTTAANARNILDAVDEFMRTKSRPKVMKGDKDQENYGEIDAFIGNLHRTISALHPDDIGKETVVMTQEEASALMQSVREVTGNLLTDPELAKDFEYYIMNKSMSRMGVNDINTGIDTKASIHTLRQDATINSQTEGSKTRLPDLASVRSSLRSVLDTHGESWRGTHDELLEHYTNIYNALKNSGFPVEFVDNAVERSTGDWQKAITKSLANGSMVMDEMSGDRARRASVFLDTEAERFDMLLTQIEATADTFTPDSREKYAIQVQDLIDSRDQTLGLSNMIKTALNDRDPYILRAVARNEGSIQKAIEALAKDPFHSDKSSYREALLQIHEDIQNQAHFQALNESTISDFIREQLSQFAMPDKDVDDIIMRISTSQFANKYRIAIRDLDKMFEVDRSSQKSAKDIRVFAENVLGDYYNNPQNVQNITLQTSINQVVHTLKGLAGDVVLTPQNFQRFVVNPLRMRMEAEAGLMEPGMKGFSAVDMDVDLYAITSGYFSKVPVKTLKVDLSTNTLVQSYKTVGESLNRGLTGILHALDPDQNHIYLAELSGIDIKGNVIRNINGFDLNNVNSALKSGNFRINSPEGRTDWYRHSDPSKMGDVNRDLSNQGDRFKVIPINWNTSLIVRIDKYTGSIHEQIRRQYRAVNPNVVGDLGGEMFRRLEAIYDGDLSLDTPEHRVIRDVLTAIRRAENEGDITEGIKLTRLILNMPGAISRVIDNGVINLDHSYIKERYKRDLLVETKNGYLPTDANRAKTAMLYRNSTSELYQNVYDQVNSWLEPDPNTGRYRKLRVLSIDDEGVLRDRQGRELENPLDSLARVRVELDRLLTANDIDQDTYNKNIREIGEAKKSILDGEMFLAMDPMLAHMAMVGLHPDMVNVDQNNQVIGFRSGALKPTITFIDVDFDRNSTSYGRVQEWFGKTAFKHNPFMDQLMITYDVDAITFKSANKINSLKMGVGMGYVDQYATLNANSADIQNDNARTMRWDRYLANPDNLIGRNVVVEIPLEAMSLRGVSREHDALVGANTGVHMSHDNGVAGWIGLESKIDMYQGGLASMYTDVYYRTALAQKILGARAESGDLAMVNSAMSAVLLRNGLIIEPWAQKRLEESMINYYMNNGAIAGGVVPDGSLDVMTADMGNLAISIRSEIGGRPTVQYFGEYLPSYYAAQKYFKHPGQELNGVHNVLIQRVNYWAESGNNRSADAFMVNIGGESFLQVEGRFINKDGYLRDTEFFENIILPDAAKNRNKRTFIQARNLQNSGLEILKNYGDLVTLADAALWLEPKNLSIGMLNSRQPRNMMGDIVISKMGIVEGSDGIRRAHVDEASGNISRMNYVDAIKPQDADFDFDKSFNYVAAPGLFWREANRLAGHVTTESMPGVFDRLFDPNINEGAFAKTLPALFKGDFTNDQIMYEVDMARGRFVKMHQTVTYLANIFRRYPTILTFENSYIEGAGKIQQVVLNARGRMPTVVNNISKMVSRYIDVNRKLPSKASVEDVAKIQNEMLFGYVDLSGQFRDGLFEIQYKSLREPKVVRTLAQDLNDPSYQHVRDAIIKRLIAPINKYLAYNRGLETDPTGMESKATIENYAHAYDRLLKLSLDPSNDWGVDKRINMEAGIKAAVIYFEASRNPYDIAMRGLHDVYNKQTILKEQGSYGKGRPVEQEIIDYIEGGYEKFVGQSREAVHNRVFNKALHEYVRDEARMLRLVDLGKQEKSLIFQIEKERLFIKNNVDTENIKNLEAKLDRIQELKISMEEALTYHFKNDPADPPKTLYNAGYKVGTYQARNKPVVVLDSAGKIKEVILKGRINNQPIYKSDKLVENGKRFKVTDGEQQKGLRILFEAFSGLPMIKVGEGKDASWMKFTSYEMRNFVETDYKRIIAQIIEAKEVLEADPRTGVMRGGKRPSLAEYTAERERIMYDALFHNPNVRDNSPLQKALILRMLIPSSSDRVISVRSVNEGSNKQAVYDYFYRENPLNEPIISLLAKISSGEHEGPKEWASGMLDDITFLKNAALITTENPHIDIDLLSSRLYTEPASLDGIMTQEKYLSRDVFDQQNAQEQITRDAARVMIDYATGKGIIDPVILYKASKEMSKRGIPIREQWGRVEYLTDENGTVREFGLKEVLVSEIESLRRKDLGERGGNEESTVNRIKSIMDCYKKSQ